MEKLKLEFTHGNAVAKLVLDDGRGNILDHTMVRELQSVFDSLEGRPELKLISFEGAGKHFSFGASVEEHRKEFAAEMLKNFHGLFYSLMKLSIPSLAKVSGQCLGGGLELALICHFIFADETAKFGQPEILLGVFPPPASIILPEKIGLAKAEELLITGKTIAAKQALEAGLLNEIFEDREKMETGVNSWIEQNILPKSASSLRFAVRAARTKFNHLLGKYLQDLEKLYVNQLMTTHDANEGINSFLEKRTPVWQNN